VGHPHLVYIRKAKGEPDLRLRRILYNAVKFAAGISRRLPHALQYVVPDNYCHKYLLLSCSISYYVSMQIHLTIIYPNEKQLAIKEIS
jgi:hypothetical protein